MYMPSFGVDILQVCAVEHKRLLYLLVDVLNRLMDCRRGGAWKPLTRETEGHKDRRT